MEKNAKIYVAGHSGLVGSAICRALRASGYTNILGVDSAELDLRRQDAVEKFFAEYHPDYVFLTAARVGGVLANKNYPVEFLYENMMIEMNVIHQCHVNGVKKLLFIGAGSIYPRDAAQPLREESLLTGVLEQTNEAYAIAKIAGLKFCSYLYRQCGKDFISVMPTNLYGPNDNYHIENSHVVPAMLRRFHEAKNAHLPFVTIWGTGTPLRDILYVDDLAEACLFLMDHYSGEEPVNVGSGREYSIAQLAESIKLAVGYEGEICYDAAKPDGVSRRLLSIEKLKSLGWNKQGVCLADGLKKTYADFLNHGIRERRLVTMDR